MITTVMAKIRKQFGLPPNATISQISEAIDAATDPTTDTPEGAAAGAEEVVGAGEANAEAPAAEAVAEDPALTREDIMAIVAEETADLVQANADLNAANAEITARLEAIETSEPEGETGGQREAAVVNGNDKPWLKDPTNQKAMETFANTTNK